MASYTEALTAIPGYAQAKGSRQYVEVYGQDYAEGHYSDLLRTRIRLSSIGIGTFPGAATPLVDAQVAQCVSRGLRAGINVIDTAAHYRYGRALDAVGRGIRDACEAGVPREGLFVISKGGFLTFEAGPPPDPRAWFEEHIAAKGLADVDDLANGIHVLSPAYIDHQIDLSRRRLGLETLDCFLIDQPEIHIPVIGKERLNEKLGAVFEVLERAVLDNRIRCYGISTFDGFRAETDAAIFQSLTSLLGWAEKAAQSAAGEAQARHHFRIAMLPFNQVMLEGFTRFNVATGQGNVASTLQAAHQLNIYIMASHTLLKGHLAQQSTDIVASTLAELPPVQRAIQFNRSTPGLGTTLVGISQTAHLGDLTAVARMPPLDRKAFLGMFARA